MNTQPPGWPLWAPDYNSIDGWMYEKKLAYNNAAFQIKDNRACRLINRSAEMYEVAIAALDLKMAEKYHCIILRVIGYRINLLTRYNPIDVYGTV